MTADFDITYEKHGNVVILKPSGNLDDRNTSVFQETLQQLYREGTKSLIIDLGAVRYLVSSSLGIICSAAKLLREKGGELYLCNVAGDVERIFEVTQLYLQMEIYETTEEALAAFSDGNTENQ